MVAIAIIKIQKRSVPILPPGKNVSVKIYPKDNMKMYTGDKKPQIGHTARHKKMGMKTPDKVITGISPGTFSMSSSLPYKGITTVIYNIIAMLIPRVMSVKFMKRSLISSFSHNCLKKLVLYIISAERATQKSAWILSLTHCTRRTHLRLRASRLSRLYWNKMTHIYQNLSSKGEGFKKMKWKVIILLMVQANSLLPLTICIVVSPPHSHNASA